MPKTNHEFVAGQNARLGARNPFPPDSGPARSWDLGRKTPKKRLPTPEEGLALLLEKGFQAHNGKELAMGTSLSQL